MQTLFNIVLVEPEIPQNTGSIGRLALGARCVLHLVHPLGFEVSDAQLRRAGLDYWEHLEVVQHESLNLFFSSLPQGANLAFFSKKAQNTYLDLPYQRGHYLIFGKETQGLPESLITERHQQTFAIPILDSRVRSLNLSNAVSVIVYEGLRQLGSIT